MLVPNFRPPQSQRSNLYPPHPRSQSLISLPTVMDGNKDEALKCVHIAKLALAAGDRPRALKFLSKAARLDPSLPLDDLLSSASAAGDSPPTPPAAPSPDLSSSSAATPPSPPNSSPEAYTEEQLIIVRQIKNQKDYYLILGLERTCTADDVRKAYRKLSLKVHPDKNKAPGADDAFKAVSKAFQCLSNEETRKRYDIVGTEDPDYNRPAAARHRRHANGFYEGDVDAEEIFRNFFFGGGGQNMAAAQFGPFGFRAAGPGFHDHRESGGFNPRALIQILPVIFLLLANILPSFFPSSEPVYMLSSSNQYQHKYETPSGVPYFVKSAAFEEEYPYESAERVALERRIEADYVGVLNQNCHVELQRRQWGFTYETPHCDMLQKYREAAAAAA